eukprot:11232258-Alexandrium_andersonii.AAC.1
MATRGKPPEGSRCPDKQLASAGKRREIQTLTGAMAKEGSSPADCQPRRQSRLVEGQCNDHAWQWKVGWADPMGC